MLIRTRLIVMITPVVVLLLILLTIYAQLNARDEAWKTANAEALAIAEERSSEVQMQMLLARGYAKSLAANGQYFLDSGQASREEVKGLVKEVLHSEPSILGVGLFFEDYDGKTVTFLDLCKVVFDLFELKSPKYPYLRISQMKQRKNKEVSNFLYKAIKKIFNS